MGAFAHPAGIPGLVLDHAAAGGTDTEMVGITVMLASRSAAAAATAPALPFSQTRSLRHALLHF